MESIPRLWVSPFVSAPLPRRSILSLESNPYQGPAAATHRHGIMQGLQAAVGGEERRTLFQTAMSGLQPRKARVCTFNVNSCSDMWFHQFKTWDSSRTHEVGIGDAWNLQYVVCTIAEFQLKSHYRYAVTNLLMIPSRRIPNPYFSQP
jgi:hypothetical protein